MRRSFVQHLALGIFFVPIIASAIDYAPLVELPIIGKGTQSIGGYLAGMFQLLIGIAGVLAVIRLVLCGFRAIMSPTPHAREHAKECVWGAISGLLLAVSAWLLLSQINPALVSTDFDPPAINSVSSGGGGAGSPTPTPTPTPTPGPTPTPTPGPTPSPGPTPTPATTPTCDSRNMCEQESGVACDGTTCSAYDGMIEEFGGNPLQMKTIMLLGSSCSVASRKTWTDPTGVSHESCGLMQLEPAVANQFLYACKDTIPGYCTTSGGIVTCDPNFRLTCSMLASETYTRTSVCIASQYLASLTNESSCGSDPRNTLAGYMSGSDACAVSSACAGERSCGGLLTRQWECSYADTGKTTCDTGYQPTRDFVRKASACMAQVAPSVTSPI